MSGSGLTVIPVDLGNVLYLKSEDRLSSPNIFTSTVLCCDLTQKYMCTLLYKEISGKSTGRVEVYKQGDVYDMRSWWSGNCVIEY